MDAIAGVYFMVEVAAGEEVAEDPYRLSDWTECWGE